VKILNDRTPTIEKVGHPSLIARISILKKQNKIKSVNSSDNMDVTQIKGSEISNTT
jgi:hypothetical protein